MPGTELREMLQEMEGEGHGEKEVLFSYNYGDHWRTNVAAKIESCQEETVVHSEYHNMDKVVDNNGEEPPAKSKQVIILS